MRLLVLDKTLIFLGEYIIKLSIPVNISHRYFQCLVLYRRPVKREKLCGCDLAWVVVILCEFNFFWGRRFAKRFKCFY